MHYEQPNHESRIKSWFGDIGGSLDLGWRVVLKSILGKEDVRKGTVSERKRIRLNVGFYVKFVIQ